MHWVMPSIHLLLYACWSNESLAAPRPASIGWEVGNSLCPFRLWSLAVAVPQRHGSYSIPNHTQLRQYASDARYFGRSQARQS